MIISSRTSTRLIFAFSFKTIQYYCQTNRFIPVCDLICTIIIKPINIIDQVQINYYFVYCLGQWPDRANHNYSNIHFISTNFQLTTTVVLVKEIRRTVSERENESEYYLYYTRTFQLLTDRNRSDNLT